MEIRALGIRHSLERAFQIIPEHSTNCQGTVVIKKTLDNTKQMDVGTCLALDLVKHHANYA